MTVYTYLVGNVVAKTDGVYFHGGENADGSSDTAGDDPVIIRGITDVIDIKPRHNFSYFSQY